MEHITLDITGPLAETERNNCYTSVEVSVVKAQLLERERGGEGSGEQHQLSD